MLTVANVMNNAMVTNIFNIDNSNIAQHRQIMRTMTYITLKFEPMIKKPITRSYTFFTVFIFSGINPFAQINSIVYIAFLRPNLHRFQRICDQDNLLFG